MSVDGPFKLRCELRGHEEDVRAVCVTPRGLATGSRDKTIRVWDEEGPTSFTVATTLVGHTDYVSALAYLPPGASSELQAGGLVSGSRDATVAVWDLHTAAPTQRMQGHTYQVSAVVTIPSGDIASASLDKTVRVWRGGVCAHVLEGHEAAVLALALLPDGDTLVSGSGDCTVRVWSLAQAKCTATIPAHTDTVRGLCVLPGVGVVSASHDTTLKVWTLQGECVAELVGHTAIVYCTAASPDAAVIASGSEDNTARIWRPDGTSLQVLDHPGCVWAAVFLPNGDLVTACSDGVARVWTQQEDRCAPAEVQEAYAARLAERKAAAEVASAQSGGGGAGLPPGIQLEDPSVLQVPGARDGQTKVVAEGGGGVAYSWDGAANKWERIGEVVAGPEVSGGSGGGKMHEGRQWDYVFDVDVADGAPPLKLAMDATENPYLVADRFLGQHELPVSYREQVVQFILQSTGGSAGAAAPGQYVDPFTGASAYVPPTAPSGGPPARAAPSGSATGGGADPFTGGAATAARHVPARAVLLFEALPGAQAMGRKVAEFNAALAADPATAGLAVEELALGPSLAGLLDRVALVPTPDAASPISDADLGLVSRLLTWPAPQLFPALDLARLVLLDAAAGTALASTAGPVSAEGAPGTLGRAIYAACTATPPVPASQQTALRAACNCFAHAAGCAWVSANADPLLTACGGAAASAVKGVRQGLATLLINLAVHLGRSPSDQLQLKVDMLSLAAGLLTAATPEDAETKFRALVAVGTLASEHSKVRLAARDLGLRERCTELKRVEGKVGEAATEVERLLRL